MRGSSAAPARPATDVVTLGAYSVVREAFHEGLIPAFAERWRRDGARGPVRGVVQRLGGAGAGDRVGVRRRHRRPVARRRHGPARQGGGRPQDWNAGPTGGWSRGAWSSSATATGTPGDPRLGRPRPAGRRRALPRPEDLGRRPLEHRRRSGGRACSGGINRRGPSPTPTPPRTCSLASSGTSSTWTARGGRAWPPSSAGPATPWSPTRTNCSSGKKFAARPIPYVTPAATLLIESPAAIVEASVVRHGNRAVAEAFLAFLQSDDGQTILAATASGRINPAWRSATCRRCPLACSRSATSAAGRRSRRPSSTPAGSGRRSSPTARRHRRPQGRRP